jgi:hypothetical protein
MIRTYVHATATAAGSAGSATASVVGVQTLTGFLKSIKVVQAESPAATTDITISISDGATSRTLLTLTDNNTASAWYNVRAQAHGQTGTGLVFAATDPVPAEIPLNGSLTVALAQADPAQTCVVTIVYED